MPGRDSGRFIGARKLDAAHRIVKRAPAQTAVVAGLCGLRRQVDTAAGRLTLQGGAIFRRVRGRDIERFRSPRVTDAGSQDRKSTRLDSSHVKMSYAFFSLEKKNIYK